MLKTFNVVINATPILFNYTAERLLMKKTYSQINAILLKKLSHTNYSFDKINLIKLCRALLNLYFGYGSPSYASWNSSTLDSLNIIQNCSVRLALRAFRTIPTPNLLREASKLIRRQNLITSFTLNNLPTQNFDPKSHFKFLLHLLIPNISVLQSIIGNRQQ